MPSTTPRSAASRISALLFVCIAGITFQCHHSGDGGPVGPIKSCSTCTYVVPVSDIPNYVVDGAALNIKAGDTICLDALVKYKSSIEFRNIIGSSVNPVIITNCNGTVNLAVSSTRFFDFKTSGSKNFRITGGDTEGYYGFRLTGSKSDGIVLTDLSTDFEVDHVEVYKVGFAGIMAKTDPTCDDATIRPNFLMKNVKLHDNFVHDTGGEGFYLGHSSYDGKDISPCGVRLPHLIQDILVYNNHVLRSGWDGLQLSCASSGAEVYDNVIENFGTEKELSQNNGIQLGGGTNGLCYRNLVTHGDGSGIISFGLGNIDIFNNVVIAPGRQGIFADERGTPTGDGYRIYNNTIINPGVTYDKEGIGCYTKTLPGAKIMNNIIVKSDAKSAANYVNVLNTTAQLNDKNFTTTKIADVKFVNNGNNFRVQSTATDVIDKGYDISGYGVDTDFYGQSRKQGAGYDIGAAEFQP